MSSEIKHFLIKYDVKAGRADVQGFGEDYEAAMHAYEELEQEARESSDVDVVLLSADSLETIKRTHSSYFETRTFEQLLPAGNRNVITDVAAAAEAARAAAVTARLNIEVNLHGVKDATLRDELTATAAVTDEIIARADQIVAAVRKEIA